MSSRGVAISAVEVVLQEMEKLTLVAFYSALIVLEEEHTTVVSRLYREILK